MIDENYLSWLRFCEETVLCQAMHMRVLVPRDTYRAPSTREFVSGSVRSCTHTHTHTHTLPIRVYAHDHT
jgi:hypothetical protein